MVSDLFKNVTEKQFVYISYMYKLDLALNNLQGSIWHKTQLNQSTYIVYRTNILLHIPLWY